MPPNYFQKEVYTAADEYFWAAVFLFLGPITALNSFSSEKDVLRPENRLASHIQGDFQFPEHWADGRPV
jgi:hypothetical protein